MNCSFRAIYKDGSEIWQHDPETGETVNTYADINRERLEVFGLYNGDRPLVMVDFSDDRNGDESIGPKRLIYRKRHLKNSKGGSVSVYLVGWQRKVNGRNVQSICFVSGDGTIILGGQWQDNRPLRGTIKALPWENDLNE